MSRPTLLLADEQPLLIAAFETLLSEACDIVGAVHDGHEMLSAATRLHPQVVIADLNLPPGTALDYARPLRSSAPGTRIIVVSNDENPDVAVEAFRSGVSGYVLKKSAASELLIAIDAVMSQRSYLTLTLSDRCAQAIAMELNRRQPVRRLTRRQREVLQLTAAGRSMKEIGHILNVAPRTVAFHKYKMMEQLDIRTTAQLIQFAIRNHLA